MYKVAIINGSPRKTGATASLLKEMASQLSKKDDIEVNYIDIVDYNLKPCIGCMSCYRTAVCCLDDKVEEINKIVKESNGLIIGAPTYSSNIPGSLKTFIDRGHFVLEQSLVGKYTFALSTFEISGGNNVISELNTLFQYSGGIPSGSFNCQLPYNTSPFSENKNGKKLKSKTEKFYNSIIKQKQKSLLDRIINYVALHIIMKPKVLQRPKQYKAVIERWITLNIIKNGTIYEKSNV